MVKLARLFRWKHPHKFEKTVNSLVFTEDLTMTFHEYYIDMNEGFLDALMGRKKQVQTPPPTTATASTKLASRTQIQRTIDQNTKKKDPTHIAGGKSSIDWGNVKPSPRPKGFNDRPDVTRLGI